MATLTKTPGRHLRAGLALLLLAGGGTARAAIPGLTGSTFTLTARQDIISTADGNSHYAWGYASGTGRMQYPGPTLIVAQGATVTITLQNQLPVPVSIVFPGQSGVSASGGVPGTLTREAPPRRHARRRGRRTRSWPASRGRTSTTAAPTRTCRWRWGWWVRSSSARPAAGRALPSQPGTQYAREHLFLLSEMDPVLHAQVYDQVSLGQPVSVDTTAFRPTIWFINGRNAPDTMQPAGVPWLPTQPYDACRASHPGERLLMRVVGAGRDLHPFHHHGNHALAIARDGRVLSSNPADTALAPDLGTPRLHRQLRAGPDHGPDLRVDRQGLGWDIYGTG